MSRLRATISASPLDREIQSQVAVAERAISRALGACASARGDEQYGRERIARVRRDLARAAGALSSIRRVTPGYDAGDPDLQPTASYEPPAPVVAPEVAPAEGASE